MNEYENDMDERIARSLGGETTEAEEAALVAWRARSAGNERHYQELARVFAWGRAHYGHPLPSPGPIDVDAEWAKLQQTLQAKPTARSVRWPLAWKLAAAVLLLVAGAALVYQLLPPATVQWETQADAREVTLPDGSTVVLNRYSTLRYPKNFDRQERALELTGEAFFEVRPDAQRPFRIAAGPGRVEVLGTSFSVATEREALQVIVASGLVTVAVQDQQVRLKAGERTDYRAGEKLMPAANQDRNYLAWRTRELVFDATDLATLLQTLERTYGVSFSLEADAPASCTFSGSFHQQSLESVLRVVSSTLGLTIDRKDNVYRITQIGC
ncbi:MAG: FecR domain-containing protein [Cyclobacteriaceae bacterium]|nr:FecR domain-containing protein [Cyclobacteriaceae bacterium]